LEGGTSWGRREKQGGGTFSPICKRARLKKSKLSVNSTAHGRDISWWGKLIPRKGYWGEGGLDGCAELTNARRRGYKEDA